MIIALQDLAQMFAAMRGEPSFTPAPEVVSTTPTSSAAPPAPAPPPPAPVQITDFPLKGVHLDASLPPEKVVEAARLLDQFGFAIDTITGVDWPAQNQMEVVYDYFHPLNNYRVAVRARLPRESPEIATICEVFPGADWHERETHDFFGIRFIGHPNLAPFLLPEDATYHPLRKDFVAQNQ